eukprot:GCRY01000791.1.p1 GENE.GCRY01000791.1~~GCRY01000791.1.p1  ORF type:complete len:380 (-),score=72.97 GCRY01000791.1:41-1180(-)
MSSIKRKEQSSPVAEKKPTKIAKTLPKKILCIGNPLLDISAEVDVALLEKHKLEADNAIMCDEKHPVYEELETKYNCDYIPGGAGQNSLRVAQWMLKDFPEVSSYIGCVGKDAYADKLKAILEKNGTTPLYQEDEKTPTGTCAVLLTGKNRSLIANLAAANNFTIDHLKKEHVKKVIDETDVFYMTGFFLTVSLESALLLAKHCADNEKTFVMNLAAPFIIEAFKDRVLQCIPYADYIFCNESEAAIFGKVMEWGDDLKTIAMKLAEMPKENSKSRVVIFTQGSKPAIIAKQGETDKLWESPVIPIEPKDIVDVNGAGDSYVGGFLSGLAFEASLDECFARANYAANVIIQRSGCSLPDESKFSYDSSKLKELSVEKKE